MLITAGSCNRGCVHALTHNSLKPRSLQHLAAIMYQRTIFKYLKYCINALYGTFIKMVKFWLVLKTQIVWLFLHLALWSKHSLGLLSLTSSCGFSGVIYLKNMVTQHWSEGDSASTEGPASNIPEEDRLFIREHIVEAIIQSPERLR